MCQEFLKHLNFENWSSIPKSAKIGIFNVTENGSLT